MRTKVLAVFKQIHQIRKQVFLGDLHALAAGRAKINEEFKKHKEETDSEKIDQYIKAAEEAAAFLKSNVIQGKLNEAGRYEVKITKDTVLLDNKLYSEECTGEPKKRGTKPRRKKSS